MEILGDSCLSGSTNSAIQVMALVSTLPISSGSGSAYSFYWISVRASGSLAFLWKPRIDVPSNADLSFVRDPEGRPDSGAY